MICEAVTCSRAWRTVQRISMRCGVTFCPASFKRTAVSVSQLMVDPVCLPLFVVCRNAPQMPLVAVATLEQAQTVVNNLTAQRGHMLREAVEDRCSCSRPSAGSGQALALP